MSSDKPFHVYANQTQEQVEHGYSASLLGKNQAFGVEVKGCHEGTYSLRVREFARRSFA